MTQINNNLTINNVVNTYVIRKEGNPESNSIHYILNEQNNIINYLNRFQNIKYQIELKVIFENINDVELSKDSYRTIKIRSDQITKLGYNVVTENDILNSIESFSQQLDSDVLKLVGSGWRIHLFKNIKIYVALINTLLGSSYIQLPFDCRSVINVKNEYDNHCFIYSVLAYLFPADKDPNRVTKYTPYINRLNLNGITSPTPLNQIPLFEKNNNLTINVYFFNRMWK